MGKGGQLYGDGWKVDFDGKHSVVYTAAELYCCTHETYIMLQTNVNFSFFKKAGRKNFKKRNIR